MPPEGKKRAATPPAPPLAPGRAATRQRSQCSSQACGRAADRERRGGQKRAEKENGGDSKRKMEEMDDCHLVWSGAATRTKDSKIKKGGKTRKKEDGGRRRAAGPARRRGAEASAERNEGRRRRQRRVRRAVMRKRRKRPIFDFFSRKPRGRGGQHRRARFAGAAGRTHGRRGWKGEGRESGKKPGHHARVSPSTLPF